MCSDDVCSDDVCSDDVCSDEAMMCGGQSELKKPDDDSKQVLESVIAELREKTGHADNVTLLGYKTQVVAGINYFLKLSLADKNFGFSIVHARVFQPMDDDQPATLDKIDTSKTHTVDSELAYF